MGNRIVLASGNSGKIRELDAMLSGLSYSIVPQSDFAIESPEETGLTFIENALIKARHAAKLSGLPAIADDSGIAVDALGGRPGIYSARYAGSEADDAQNIAKMLTEMRGVDLDERRAAFHCVLVFLRHALDPVPIVCHGVWQGRILEAPDGDGGFGYDPVFWSPETQCSAARLSKAEKNALSHRGKALKALVNQLQQIREQ